MADFVPCDRLLQKAYCTRPTRAYLFQIALEIIWLPIRIVGHEVQLLINRILTNFRIKNVFQELLLSESVRSAFPEFLKTVENIAKEAIKA